MRRCAQIALALIATASMGGCAVSQPSYDAVRDEATTALRTISDLIADPKTIDVGPEQAPYNCSEPLFLSGAEGAFYTGHWTVEVSEAFDIPAFIGSLATNLGNGWKTESLNLDVPFPSGDLVETSSGVSVAVEDHSHDGEHVVDLIAISRCGRLPNDGPLGPRGVRGE